MDNAIFFWSKNKSKLPILDCCMRGIIFFFWFHFFFLLSGKPYRTAYSVYHHHYWFAVGVNEKKETDWLIDGWKNLESILCNICFFFFSKFSKLMNQSEKAKERVNHLLIFYFFFLVHTPFLHTYFASTYSVKLNYINGPVFPPPYKYLTYQISSFFFLFSFLLILFFSI